MSARKHRLIAVDDTEVTEWAVTDVATIIDDHRGFSQQKGVEMRTGELVIGVDTRGDRLAVNTHGGQDIIVDGSMAEIGLQPNVELAQTARLEVGNGLVVDESLRTSHAARSARWICKGGCPLDWGE